MKLCGFEVGLDQPIFLIAGTCVIESRQMAMDVAGQLKEITSALGIPYIYKSSFDKANRSSGKSFRGPGMEKGLEILADVRKEIGVPVLTDVHTEEEIPVVASVVDVTSTSAVRGRTRSEPEPKSDWPTIRISGAPNIDSAVSIGEPVPAYVVAPRARLPIEMAAIVMQRARNSTRNSARAKTSR